MTPDEKLKDIETKLWKALDDATNYVKNGKATGPLNRNVTSTESSPRAEAYRQRILTHIQGNTWDAAGEKGVIHCAKRAGRMARVLADRDGNRNLDLATFNLACELTEQIQKVDSAANTAQLGIIC